MLPFTGSRSAAFRRRTKTTPLPETTSVVAVGVANVRRRPSPTGNAVTLRPGPHDDVVHEAGRHQELHRAHYFLSTSPARELLEKAVGKAARGALRSTLITRRYSSPAPTSAPFHPPAAGRDPKASYGGRRCVHDRGRGPTPREGRLRRRVDLSPDLLPEEHPRWTHSRPASWQAAEGACTYPSRRASAIASAVWCFESAGPSAFDRSQSRRARAAMRLRRNAGTSSIRRSTPPGTRLL